MADQYIFTMLGLNKYYGQKQVLKNINLCFYPGAKIGIVGENGSGKSTVLNIMAGNDEEFQGDAFITKGYEAGMVKQEPLLSDDWTVHKTIESAFQKTADMLKEFEDISASMANPMSDDEMQTALDKMGQLQETLDATDAWNLDYKIKLASDALCLPGNDRIINTLSGGEKRRVALCKALLEQPDLLLLDEPTNHLDAETVSWLENQLKDYPGTVLIVTHDRYFLDNITKWILELEGGAGIPYEGNYTSWLEQKITRLSEKAKDSSPRAKALGRELSWIKMNNKDRAEMARNRIAEYEQLVARETAATKNDNSLFQIAPGPELGSKVITFENVSKQFDDLLLFENAGFTVPRSAVVGLVGPNGTGKTTLFKMIVGEEKPTSGSVEVGSSVKISYVNQERDMLDSEKSLIEEIGEGASEILIGNREIPIRKYIAQFGFKGADQQKNVGDFSGGERNRCQLAKVLKSGGNVLLLDEPTNDLDVNTLRMLEEAILNFSGCVLTISHDRFFLNRICTHLIVFEGDGKLHWFEGNFDDYEEWRKKELGSSYFENRRNRYRKLLSK
ncbi:MAG: energy-dependent translational throttle protein EttA [candidate division Zixibacteria bacterium]|nr:energy-dependent translational throttle protein EttA [candidate division Zixibacteria bacterium]